MAEVQYTVAKRTLTIEGEKQERFVAKLVSTGKDTTKDIAKKTIMQGTVSDIEVPQFIDLLVRMIKEELKSGLRVQLGDLGTFTPAITCKMVKKADDLSHHAISRKTIKFAPSTEVKQEMKKVSFRKANLDIKHV